MNVALAIVQSIINCLCILDSRGRWIAGFGDDRRAGRRGDCDVSAGHFSNLGASELLASGILGVEAETSFATSVVYPEASFGLVQACLIKHGLLIADLNFNRVRREAYQQARRLRGLPELPLVGAGKPATFNVLFCRDPVAEINSSVYYEKVPPPLRVDQILKLMAIYELHGLNDIAVDIAVAFANELGRRLDVERAVDLLCDNIDLPVPMEVSAPVSIEHTLPPQVNLSWGDVLRLETESAALKEQIRMIYASSSWRITTPLRAVANALKRWI